MLCYQDMTFCPFWKKCKHGDGCIRAETDEVVQEAESRDMPICHYMEEPPCFEQLTEEE